MNSPLPPWIERLLGLESGPGEGAAWRLEYTWPWPSWLTLLAVSLAVVFIVITYLRENRQAPRWFRLGLAAVRVGLLVILLMMLAQFSISLERTGLANVVLLLDDSLSMETQDGYPEEVRSAVLERLKEAGLGAPSRWNLARALLTGQDGRMLRALEERYQLRCYYLTGPRAIVRSDAGGVADELRAQPLPSGERTRLGAAVRTVLDDLRGSLPAAIVVLSDGINNDGPSLYEAAGYARRRGVPLYAIGVGDERPLRDLKLSDLLVDEVVFVDDVVYFEAKLSATGFENRPAEVVLRRDGKPDVLARVKVTLGADDRPQPVRVAYRPREEGEFRFVLEVVPQEGEQRTDNNRQEKTIRVRKERIRVLLMQGYPNYEYRYLRNMLARDTTIQLSTVLQDADLEYAEQDSAALAGFPVGREDLFQYDVVILGDVNPASFSGSMLENLADFVRQPGKGGALVCIAGPRYLPLAFRQTPLAGLLPIDLDSARIAEPARSTSQAFRAEPTELGLTRPAMQLGTALGESRAVWAGLAPLHWMLEAEPKPGAQVLAESSPRGPEGRRWPLILLQYVGAGRVLLHTTDETWRWRIRAGDVYFARYWVQTLRYLSRSKLFEGNRGAVLSTDRQQYARGEAVPLRLRFFDDRLAPADAEGVSVVVECAGQQNRQVGLRRTTGRGLFEGLLANPPVGDCHAWLAAPTLPGKVPAVDFRVTAPEEAKGLPMNAADLREAAEKTRGGFYTPVEAERLLDDLPEGRQVPIETLPPKSLWNQWPLLTLFLGLLVAEWLLRKAGGMV